MKLILASGSPRRKQLLEQIGLTDFHIITSDVDETIAPGTSPAQAVEELSLKKARAVLPQVEGDAVILAADTVVALGDKILGKPADQAAAMEMLTALSGGEHQVYTGVTLLSHQKEVTFHQATTVQFRTLTQTEIAAYVATGESLDKAGAYGIQGKGALLVEGILGDYFNVMGLPLCKVGLALQGF